MNLKTFINNSLGLNSYLFYISGCGRKESQSEGFQRFALAAPRTPGRGRSPDVHDADFVLCFTCPQGNLVPFGADVHDSTTYLPAVFLEALPEQTQQLGPKEDW